MLSLLDNSNNTHESIHEHSLVCFKEGDMLVCGFVIDFDLAYKLESKMVDEPYYGEIDLFGF